jgi:TetR/AcrR family transcriptional regulator, transcriptional repressor for nem operon
MAGKGDQTRERILAATEPLVLENGFAGTSLDDILKATDLTKGAFFHHFKGKGDLARALVERYVANDLALFERFAAEAEATGDDPLDQAYAFLKLFETFINNLPKPLAGCLLATYVYESMQFESAIQKYITQSFRRWSALYETKFEAVLARRRPARPVSARELADMIVAIIEGGFIISRAYNDPYLIARQSKQFRQYLELLFEDAGEKRKSARA